MWVHSWLVMRSSRRSLAWCQAWDHFSGKEEDCMIWEDKVANKEDDVDGARIGVDYATKVEFIGEKEDSVESTCTS